MHIERLKWEHLRNLHVQPRHFEAWDWLVSREEYKEWAETSDSWSLLDKGAPLACAGVYDHMAWAFIGENIGSAGLYKATKFIKKLLASYDYVYADSDTSFENGERWLAMLGFEPLGGGKWLRLN